jgi:hypothetical protein
MRNRPRSADFSPQDHGIVERAGLFQVRGLVPGSGGLKSAFRLMRSPLFLSDQLTGRAPEGGCRWRGSVLECGRPLPLSTSAGLPQSARGLAHSKNRAVHGEGHGQEVLSCV